MPLQIIFGSSVAIATGQPSEAPTTIDVDTTEAPEAEDIEEGSSRNTLL